MKVLYPFPVVQPIEAEDLDSPQTRDRVPGRRDSRVNDSKSPNDRSNLSRRKTSNLSRRSYELKKEQREEKTPQMRNFRF